MEKIAHLGVRKKKNANGKKHHEVFIESYRELAKEGAKMGKRYGNFFYNSVPLIITIMSIAAFIVLSGNNKETSFPILLKRTLFEVFTIVDVIALMISIRNNYRVAFCAYKNFIIDSCKIEQDFFFLCYRNFNRICPIFIH